MTNDIRVTGNMIDGRQGWAYICNSMKFEVLKVDIDKKQEYDDYKTFEKVKVVTTYRGQDLGHTTTLECCEGEWALGCGGCMLTADFGYSDMKELIENAGLPVVREGDVVALAMFSKSAKLAYLMLYKIGKVDPHCQTVAKLIKLTDDEMAQVAKDADRWCKR